MKQKTRQEIKEENFLPARREEGRNVSMCTCITWENGAFYFGRNLDLEYSFGEQVALTPRNYPFQLRCLGEMNSHYAMIGMATVMMDYPLYAEAVNEKGLAMAGLNFPGSAVYQEPKEGARNVTPFELIPWLLGTCATVRHNVQILSSARIVNLPFSEQVPLAPLHWMLADRKQCVVLEAVKEGLQIYQNPFGVLANNPPFPYHQMNMQNYLNLTAGSPKSRFGGGLRLKPYGQGMGAIGLPGDASPASRFVRAAFLKWNSRSEKEEQASVTQFFHILDGVAMTRGMVLTPEGKCDITTYSCCMNGDKGIYYYKTYENNRIQAVDMHKEQLDSEKLMLWKIDGGQDICSRN